MPGPEASQPKQEAVASNQGGNESKQVAEQTVEKGKITWGKHELQELEFGNVLGRAYAAATLAVYFRTMHPTVAGGDSGELMGCACELGVAHPPGYPLFTMLNWLGMQVIPFGGPGFRMNAVSVVFATSASWLLFHAVLRWHLGLMHEQPESSWRGSAWVALLASALYSFCPLVWTYSTHAEVFAMNNMFISLLQYLAVRYVQDRDVRWARLGALSIGLGLSNQHTLLLHAIPLVGWMVWIGRKQLLTPTEVVALPLLGLLGMTPYLYLFWAATHAPLGSWGDTSTLYGWPYVGFWTHFLRKEYGTFSLFAEKAAKITTLWLAAEKYSMKAMQDMMMVAWAAPIGVGVSWRRGGMVNAGSVGVSCFAFYMWVFHSRANLPIDIPLYLGVHMRFWMQAHVVLVGFVAVGLEGLLSLLYLWRRPVAVPLVLAACVAQLAAHARDMDQSNNWYTYEFGRRLLDSKSQDAILLTQGDLVTNSIRYQQRCERRRLDVALLDMHMMTFEWFKTMHGPHFPGGIEFPGLQFSLGGVQLKEHRTCCPYSTKQFLDANLVDGGRPVYMIGGWYGSENSDGMPVGVPGYHAEPIGYGAKLTRVPNTVKDKEFKSYVKNFSIPTDLPDPKKYDKTTWESIILNGYITYAHAFQVTRMDRAVAKGKEEVEGSPWIEQQGELRGVIAALEELVELAEAADNVFENLYSNLGIAYGRLKCPHPYQYPKVDCPGQTKMREMMKKFLAVTTRPKEKVAAQQLVVDNPDSFINLG